MQPIDEDFYGAVGVHQLVAQLYDLLNLDFCGKKYSAAMYWVSTNPPRGCPMAEMEKAADAADMYVLFFSAGANF